jgi:formate-dependent nitrite reductase membrane component NrfD
MNEYTTTRHNELVDPSLHIWGWEIPVYLFIGGLVAGMMIITGYFIFKGRYKDKACVCRVLPLLGMIILSAGMLALFLDLEHKLYTWRLYTTFKVASPMSWGAWILIVVYPTMIASFLINVPEYFSKKFPWMDKISEKLQQHKYAVKNIGVVNMLLGGLLGIYTGVLLSALGARPLWNSSMLWLLFLVSGLSAASAFVHMVAKRVDERELLAKADNGFLILELFVIGLYLIGMLTSTKVHIQSALELLSGIYAPAFWVFVLGLGIVVPLIIQLLAVNHKIKHTPIAPIMVIVGGLILRFVIVYAGQYTHWVDASLLP